MTDPLLNAAYQLLSPVWEPAPDAAPLHAPIEKSDSPKAYLRPIKIVSKLGTLLGTDGVDLLAAVAAPRKTTSAWDSVVRSSEPGVIATPGAGVDSGAMDPGRAVGSVFDDAFYRDADGHLEFTPHGGSIDKIGADSAASDAPLKGYRDRVEIFAFDGQGRVLVNREPSGRLSFPGGGRDGASINAAAHKEMAEETGYKLTGLRPAGPKPVPVTWPESIQQQQAEKGRPFLGERTAWRVGLVSGKTTGFDSEGDGKKQLGFIEVDRAINNLNAEAARASDKAQRELLHTRIRALERAAGRHPTVQQKDAEASLPGGSLSAWFRPDTLQDPAADTPPRGGDYALDHGERKTVDEVFRALETHENSADVLRGGTVSTTKAAGRVRFW